MSGRRRSVMFLVVIGFAAVGCSSERSDAEAASTTCTALREANNRIVTIVNESVAGIGAAGPDERLGPVVVGLRDLQEELLVWDAEIDELDLPASDEGRLLAAQLHDGVDLALAELHDQAADFDPMDGPIPDEEVAGFVGTWFNSVEKVVSSLEPEIFRFERQDFKQAFLDEPDCRNVIQQFVNE